MTCFLSSGEIPGVVPAMCADAKSGRCESARKSQTKTLATFDPHVCRNSKQSSTARAAAATEQQNVQTTLTLKFMLLIQASASVFPHIPFLRALLLLRF